MTGESLIKNVLSKARSQIQEEVGGLLGTPLQVTKPQIKRISKGEFFAGPGRNLALTRVAVDGDLQAEVAIFIRLKDAILLGGTLIMLPPSELAERMKKEAFGEEEADAFGEIANIITGVLNSAFGEDNEQKLRFRKVEVLPVIGDDLDLDSDEPFPAQDFFLGSYPMVFEDEQLGELEILFPIELAGEENSHQEEKASPPISEPAGKPLAEQPSELSSSDAAVEESGEETTTAGAPLLLLLADSDCEVDSISRILIEENFATHRLGLQDDLKGFLQAHREILKGVILIMEDISDRGFAAAIQVCSNPGAKVPLLAAGPRWTKSSVVQAAKFGVSDILVTPAAPEVVRRKVARYLT